MFARAKRIKKPRISEADIALLLMVNLLGGCHGRRLRYSSRNCWPTYCLPVSKIAITILTGLHNLFEALRLDVFLQDSQGCLVADDSGSDTENVSSSNVREFDGGFIAHAGGAGGFGCG